LDDELVRQAKAEATQQGESLDALVEQALRDKLQGAPGKVSGHIDSFLDRVRATTKELRTRETRVWYRGLSNREHTLVPSLFRDPTGRPREKVVSMDRRQREKNLFARFKTQAGQLLPHGLESSWEVLSVMQHHGVPTRIMDWTDSLFVALYFALEYKDTAPPYKDTAASPCLWLLNPFALNEASLGQSRIFDQVDRLPRDAYNFFIDEEFQPEAPERKTLKHWPPKLPVATAPIWGHPRALRQRGFFTIHGLADKPLEQQAKDLVKQIEIPAESQEPLRLILRDAGIDHYALFPDLDGLARKLRQRYGWT